ncbi:unnamed protein product, partial [Prorocentrum cordatum]
ASVDLQAYVHASHGEGYCARNPSNDPCLGWQVFGDGCTDCAATCARSSGRASTPGLLRASRAGRERTAGGLACVDLQAYVHASHGEGYCARNPSNDPCLGWQVFGDGCTDCAASGMRQRVPAAVAGPVRRDCLVQVVLGGRGLRVDLRPDGRHKGRRRPAGVRPRVSRRGLLRSEPVQRPVPRLAGVRRWLHRLLGSRVASTLLHASSWSIRVELLLTGPGGRASFVAPTARDAVQLV